MRSAIDSNQLEALDQFGFRAAVPLFRRIGEDADHLATGLFITVDEKLFLLTARHILDECPPEDIAIPTSPEGSALRTLGNLVVHTPIDMPDTDIDVMALEIRDQDTIAIARSGWRIVDIAIGDEAFGNGELVLIGYPSATLKKTGMQMKGRPTGVITSMLAGSPEGARKPVNPALDMFLDLPREAITKKGIVEVPPIGGMSGCAIWELRETPDNGLWSPDRALRLVGIQSSAKAGAFFRGKRWAYVRVLLEQAA